MHIKQYVGTIRAKLGFRIRFPDGLDYLAYICYNQPKKKGGFMCRKFTEDELNCMDHDTKNDVIYHMQERLDRLAHNYENLMEQIHLANQQRF